MNIKNISGKMNIKRSVYAWVFFLLLLRPSAQAQSQPGVASLKADSLYKANQLKTQQASLDAEKEMGGNVAKSKVATKNHDTRPMSERIGFDINTSFWINASSTFFEFSPVLVYNMPKMISIGAGPTYIYNRDRINKVNLNGWGGKVFSRAQLTNWFYAYTEYQGIDNQYISGIDLSNNKITTSSGYVDSWFLSLGVNIRVGKRHGINMQALYDVLYDNTMSPYYGAWTYRIGFGF